MAQTIGVSIARNGRERTIARFTHYHEPVEALMDRLHARGTPAYAWFSNDHACGMLAMTNNYRQHQA